MKKSKISKNFAFSIFFLFFDVTITVALSIFIGLKIIKSVTFIELILLPPTLIFSTFFILEKLALKKFFDDINDAVKYYWFGLFLSLFLPFCYYCIISVLLITAMLGW